MTQGIGASSGIAIGKAFVLPNWEFEVPEQRIDVADFAREFERVYEGIRTSKDEINQIKDELKETVGEEETQIFDAHLAILDDPVFMNEIQGIIQRQYKAAEVAVKEAIDHFVTMFDLLEDDYMRERALDIKDVGNRLLKHLLGVPEIQLPSDTQPFILIAKEISPSQLAHLNPENVLGIVTLSGSTTSHSAIMARALGIPLVVGMEGKITESFVTGQTILIDGGDGTVYLDPAEHLINQYRDLQHKLFVAKEQLHHLADHEAVTIDGQCIKLEANISSVKELEIAMKGGAQGVGLFRTEFLYMDRQDFPTEEEQYQVYRKVVEKLHGGSVVIRTLDIGGDKHLDYYEIEEEENPFMGYRAIRISLDQKQLFKTQLRAILRASAYGTIKVMYPFITSVNEVRAANTILQEAKNELTAEGIGFADEIAVGIMIEVPAAVMIADHLAREVDFFSIGTNDLVQFTLAVDRMNEKISTMYDPYHPAIIQMLSIAVDAAKRHEIPISVCGELAGDIRALPIWLSLGVDALSMSAHSILPLKERLIHSSKLECKQVFNEVIHSSTSEEIKHVLTEYMITFEETANG
ncbi:phosphoenolpyruvate--protein phosphotransferase [Paenibacillus endoradicis]|uniref:phosphoenolpyruvate--protein phosphotransferase n=1 Tax=Paenibacillus endoradicis TaxID=2972487 RepID=UPI002158B814|nr:phosphoenolpyruvate--protein phosphotransferase [Paenibacillus endoradicis]MCR8656058.1 phosphoenolpyruvate--protein phosphotransferase [Paenibacillus endoradicis]MCR8658384.1 phosphoenolpyruvate--protein phosphotransferase [Paenibacillus endoradicis]